MDKEVVVYTHTHSGILLSHKMDKSVICTKMYGSRDYGIKLSKLDKGTYHTISFIFGILKKKGTNELI